MDALHGWLSSISCPYDSASLLSGHSVAYLLDYHNLSTSPLSSTLSPPLTNRAVLSNWNRITHEMGRIGIPVPSDSTAMIMAGDQEEVWAKFLRPLFTNLNSNTPHATAATSALSAARTSYGGDFQSSASQYVGQGSSLRVSGQLSTGGLGGPTVPSLSLVPTDSASDALMREISSFLTLHGGGKGKEGEVGRLLEELNGRGTIIRDCLRTHPASRHACVGVILGLITLALGMKDEVRGWMGGGGELG